MDDIKSAAMEQAQAYLDQQDFNPIINKLARQKGWSKTKAALACEQYKRYLYLQKKYGNTYLLAPSKDIDEVWHLHILDSKKYHNDCLRLFGNYLHHYPFYEGISLTDNQKGAFERTLRFYRAEFGEPLYAINLSFFDAIKTCFRLFIYYLYSAARRKPLSDN